MYFLFSLLCVFRGVALVLLYFTMPHLLQLHYCSKTWVYTERVVKNRYVGHVADKPVHVRLHSHSWGPSCPRTCEQEQMCKTPLPGKNNSSQEKQTAHKLECGASCILLTIGQLCPPLLHPPPNPPTSHYQQLHLHTKCITFHLHSCRWAPHIFCIFPESPTQLDSRPGLILNFE